MKHISLSLILWISFVFLYAQKTDEDRVNKFIDTWHQDAANVDMKAYFDKIDEGGVFIGTDETEIWSKKEFHEWSKPFFEGGKAWEFTAIDRNIYFAKKSRYAWFDELLSFSGGTLRGSGVLIKKKSGWKISHYVLSLPVPNEKFKAVLKAISQ